MRSGRLANTDPEQQDRQQELTDEARKNKGFTQVYPLGWKRITELAKGNAAAAGLYAFFAQHLDPACGAVVCDQQFLATQFDVNRSTISRWLAYLEKAQALVRIPIAGRVCAYALDPNEVWKGYDNAKDYAAFTTRALINKNGEIKRRIMSMFEHDNAA